MMLDHIIKYPVEALATFASVFPLAVMFYRSDYKKKLERYFFIYLCAKLVIESIMLVMASAVINNLFLYNALVLISYCLLTRMCYEAIDDPSHKKIVIGGSVLFIVVFVMDTVECGINQVGKLSGTVQCLLMIVYIILFFYGLIKSLKIENLLLYSPFWIFCGMLLFYATTTFATPIYNHVENFGSSKELYIIILLPYMIESFYLFCVGLAIMLQD